ncbi:MAG: anti-sigma factor family protein [Ktedonobacteraceae bacterium]
MNCIEAQVMLAAHRELKNVDVDTTELDEHLEQCSSCRQVLASYSSIGEQIRALPAIEPPPDMHDKLMRALVAEHFQFMQRSPATTPPPPDFLKPYMQEHAHSSHHNDSLAAFSTANTGPLPVLTTPYKKRPRRRMSGQFAILAMAAVFFMALMMGGITSLLLLAKDHAPVVQQASISLPTEVSRELYTTHTSYQHVVSAVGDATSIYYTAYGDGANNGWMIERLDRRTKISTPLLTTASASPLIIMGSENGWLVWLQFDTPKTTGQGTLPHSTLHSLSRSWSLHYLSLAPSLPGNSMAEATPMTLISGTFDQEAVPSWVHGPIQGIWFIQNTLLVAMIGDNGVAHLVRYPLVTPGSSTTMDGFTTKEIAQASANHIFTSPTASSDGSQIYWSEEWRTDDGTLHSNIWTRQVLDTPVSGHGKLVEQPITVTQPFLQDGMSFRPVVVDDALFLLNSGKQIGFASPTPGSATQTPLTNTPTPTATPNSNLPTMSWADSSVYTLPLDNEVRGNLLMFPLDGNPAATPTLISASNAVSGLQAGKDFVLWQSDDGSYGMYDASTRNSVIINDVLNGAQFVAVNGTTAVWTVNNSTNTSANSNDPTATLQVFNWPRK